MDLYSLAPRGYLPMEILTVFVGGGENRRILRVVTVYAQETYDRYGYPQPLRNSSNARPYQG